MRSKWQPPSRNLVSLHKDQPVRFSGLCWAISKPPPGAIGFRSPRTTPSARAGSEGFCLPAIGASANSWLRWPAPIGWSLLGDILRSFLVIDGSLVGIVARLIGVDSAQRAWSTWSTSFQKPNTKTSSNINSRSTCSTCSTCWAKIATGNERERESPRLLPLRFPHLFF